MLPGFASGIRLRRTTTQQPHSKRIVTKFFQDFLYIPDVPMRNMHPSPARSLKANHSEDLKQC